MAEGTKERDVGTGVVTMNIFSDIVAWMSANVVAPISFMISIIALWISLIRLQWDRRSRTYNFINSIRYWKFDLKDVKSMQDSNIDSDRSFTNENYIGVNVSNSTEHVINKCMILFKARNTMSWKDYCEELIYQGVADYIIYTDQLSPMKDNLYRYLLTSPNIEKMDLALCIKDVSGKIWLKPMEGKLIKIKKSTYANMLALETHFSQDVHVNELVSQILKDGQQRFAELDQNFKVLQ